MFFSVMSSASSAVTYTSMYTDSEPGRVFWGADEEISDGNRVKAHHPLTSAIGPEQPALPDYDEGTHGGPPLPLMLHPDGDDEPSGDDTDDDDADDEIEGAFPGRGDDDGRRRSTQLRLTLLLYLLAQKTVRPEPPMSTSMEARIAEHAAAPTPLLPIASSPLPLPSPLTTSPTDAGAPLGNRAAGISG
ncbi:hypothetical protein Tco_1338433 [Tanacetum coccineum]